MPRLLPNFLLNRESHLTYQSIMCLWLSIFLEVSGLKSVLGVPSDSWFLKSIHWMLMKELPGVGCYRKTSYCFGIVHQSLCLANADGWQITSGYDIHSSNPSIWSWNWCGVSFTSALKFRMKLYLLINAFWAISSILNWASRYNSNCFFRLLINGFWLSECHCYVLKCYATYMEARRYCGTITPSESEWLRCSCGICILTPVIHLYHDYTLIFSTGSSLPLHDIHWQHLCAIVFNIPINSSHPKSVPFHAA